MSKSLRRFPLSRFSTPEDSDPLIPLRKEIAILKKLRHPHVIRLYEVLEDQNDDSVYMGFLMVFEYCQKGPLMKISLETEFKAFKEDVCWKYFRQVLLGIHYLHNQKIAHRDIKPDNLLVDSSGIVKIADFGVSEMFDSRDLNGKSAGSPAFMAPELLHADRGECSMLAADRWSMGVTLYCMAYGKVPFNGSSILELNQTIRSKEPSYNELTSPALIDIIQKLIKKNPKERLTLNDAMTHPWITKGGKKPLHQYPQEHPQQAPSPTPVEVENAVKLGIIERLSRHMRALSAKGF